LHANKKVIAFGAAALAVMALFGAAYAAAKAPTRQRTVRPAISAAVASSGGEEMSPQAAGSSVVRYARMARQYDELTVSVSHGSFAQAAAVSEGRPVAEAETAGPPGASSSWLESPAYLVVLKTKVPGGIFRPNLPTPHNRVSPSGSVLTLIVEAKTGFVEGRTVSSEEPNVGALGAVTVETAAPESASAFAASARALEQAEAASRASAKAASRASTKRR
jgi:hypothetical protein